MANRFLSRLAWAAAGAALAIAPRVIQLARKNSPRRIRSIGADPELPAAIPIAQLTRYRSARGVHSIHATLLAEFPSGERTTTLVVAFCPPFEQLPTVEAHANDDSGTTVKVTQLLHNGVQLEVRLPEPAEDTLQITVEVLATEPPAAGA